MSEANASPGLQRIYNSAQADQLKRGMNPVYAGHVNIENRII